MKTTPRAFLETSCIRERRTPLLWSLVLALVAVAGLEAERLGWWKHGSLAGMGAALAAAAGVVYWYARGRTLSAARLARRLDERWALSSRLETSLELADETSALAKAQREEAAQRVETKPEPQGAAWAGGLGLLALAAMVLLSELAVETWRWRNDKKIEVAAAKLPAAPDASGTIAWKTPRSEIKATAIEEVPLTAAAESRAGFHEMTLEVAVNGEAKLSRPLDAAAWAAAKKPGAHDVALSLYLDEVGAQEFDMVSYHLRARTTPGGPVIASPLQFVQIRPARDDARQQDAGGEGRPPQPETPAVATLRQLKAAQLQLLKDNFQLAHAPVARTDPVWIDANTRVAADQRMLAAKTAEFRATAIAGGHPTLVVDNLGQAAPLMEEAGEKIAATANEPAAKPQSRALALITATEKIITRAISQEPPPAAGRPSSDADPFKDEQTYKMPPRPATPAGRVEELARKQEEVSRDLDENKTDDAAAEQSDLARDLAKLAAEKTLSPGAQSAVERAAKDAAEASKQLAQNDPAAARSPAAAAAAALNQAVAAQEREGRTAAQAELEAARRALSEAARAGAGEARSARLNEVAEELNAGAQAQQRSGSAEAARRMAELSEATKKAAAGAGSGSGPGEGSDPAELARAAARAQAALTPRDELMARAERQAARAEAGLDPEKTDTLTAALTEAELAAQLGEALLPDEAGRLLARAIAGDAARARQATVNGGIGPAAAHLRESVHALGVALATARSTGKRDEIVRRFNPDEIDPAYRAAVETYFEKLSREGASR